MSPAAILSWPHDRYLLRRLAFRQTRYTSTGTAPPDNLEKNLSGKSFHLRQDPRIFAGALFVAALSIITELLFALVQRLVVPKALRRVPLDVERTPMPPALS